MRKHYNQVTITSADNSSVIKTSALNKFTGITASWKHEDIMPAGILTFTVDDDAGCGNNTIDFSRGQRSLVCNVPLAFVDIAVAGLPERSSVTLYFR